MGCAARWKTISGRWVAIVSRTASKSRMSPRTSMIRSLRPEATKLLGWVGGSGWLKPMTVAPSSSSHVVSHDPLKPVWPVMSTGRLE